MLEQWSRTLHEGVAVLGPATPAGERMRETYEFVEFLRQELPSMLARWRRRQAQTR
jgi:hypothetical protein